MYQSTVPYLVAGVGFEPHDLRVMSPTSYQAALPRDINGAGNRGRTGTRKISRDFKSRASANSAIPAYYRSVTCHNSITHSTAFVKGSNEKDFATVHFLSSSFALFRAGRVMAAFAHPLFAQEPDRVPRSAPSFLQARAPSGRLFRRFQGL